MEDIQDGKKVSIQDGVTEDPEFEEKFVIFGRTTFALLYALRTIPATLIETVVDTHIAEDLGDCTITTILGTAVA